MSATYTPVTLLDFAALAHQMGMVSITPPNTKEYVFERDVVTKSGIAYPLKLRIYSSVDIRTGISRDCGSDAIRLCLVNKNTDRGLKNEKRINRCGDDIMARVLERAREMFKYAIDPVKNVG